jgi:hypothetical protein
MQISIATERQRFLCQMSAPLAKGIMSTFNLTGRPYPTRQYTRYRAGDNWLAAMPRVGGRSRRTESSMTHSTTRFVPC